MRKYNTTAMKKAILFLTLIFLAVAVYGKTVTNRYGMKLEEKKDGSYALQYKIVYKLIAKINVNEIPDVLVPYKPKSERLHEKDWKGLVETVDYTFKSYPTYDLQLTVDKVKSDTLAPFMIYIHGGAWKSGNRNSPREISQYLAHNAGVVGVRISYTLAGKPDADVTVSIEDVKDAVQFIKENSTELNIDTTRFGFLGTSAGAHLAAMGAMTIPGVKLLVGIVGVYDLPMLARMTRRSDAVLEHYFLDKNRKELAKVSPVNVIPDKNIPAVMLIHGTGDWIVSYKQSVEFAEALKEKGGEVDLNIYPYYGHNVVSRDSDKKEECFFKAYDFIVGHLK